MITQLPGEPSGLGAPCWRILPKGTQISGREGTVSVHIVVSPGLQTQLPSLPISLIPVPFLLPRPPRGSVPAHDALRKDADSGQDASCMGDCWRTDRATGPGTEEDAPRWSLRRGQAGDAGWCPAWAPRGGEPRLRTRAGTGGHCLGGTGLANGNAALAEPPRLPALPPAGRDRGAGIGCGACASRRPRAQPTCWSAPATAWGPGTRMVPRRPSRLRGCARLFQPVSGPSADTEPRPTLRVRREGFAEARLMSTFQ